MASKSEEIKVAKRVEAWQKRLAYLGIGHWRIDQVSVVDETPGGRTANATAQVSHQYDTCWFWFTHEFVDSASPEKMDEIIVHEWVHVAMRDLDQAIESIADEVGTSARSLWEDRVGHEREGLVDRFARQISALYNVS